MDDYNRSGHSKYSLKVHIIFVTKYRKNLFLADVKDDVKQFLFDAAERIHCKIIQMETDKNHAHLLIEYAPSQKISDIAKYLKQYSTTKMWQLHKNMLQREYWKNHILWSDGYFACSIGQVSQSTIERYIQNQG